MQGGDEPMLDASVSKPYSKIQQVRLVRVIAPRSGPGSQVQADTSFGFSRSLKFSKGSDNP